MKVINLINSTYQVVNSEDYYEVYYQGSLSDCDKCFHNVKYLIVCFC